IPSLYIADGHHRAASAARVRHDIRNGGITRRGLGDGADYTTFLAVAFPDNRVRILPYNRIVKDFAALNRETFFKAVSERFDVRDATAVPVRRGEISMYLDGRWLTLRSRTSPSGQDPTSALDVSVLHHQLLEPVLGIGDVRTDKRLDFVGGPGSTAQLER